MGKKTKYLLILLGILLVGVVLTNGVSYAKYVSNSVLNYYLKSKGFYFESDSLTLDGNEFVDTAWDGNSIYFSLKNSLNDVLATDTDIKYTVTCEVLGDDTTKQCLINGTSSNTYSATLSAVLGCSNYSDDSVDVSNYDEDKCTANDYVWESQVTIANLYFDVVDSNGDDVDTASVKVTAKATSPYTKTLSAKYNLTKDKNDIGTLMVSYEELDTYSNVVVTNSYDEDKCLTLRWDADDLVLDTSSNVYLKYSIDVNYYINEITFDVSKLNSLKFRFYRRDLSKTFTDEDFVLVESSDCDSVAG